MAVDTSAEAQVTLARGVFPQFSEQRGVSGGRLKFRGAGRHLQGQPWDPAWRGGRAQVLCGLWFERLSFQHHSSCPKYCQFQCNSRGDTDERFCTAAFPVLGSRFHVWVPLTAESSKGSHSSRGLGCRFGHRAPRMFSSGSRLTVCNPGLQQRTF